MLNDKLCKGKMLDEYLDILRAQNKLVETINRLGTDADISEMDDDQLVEVARKAFEDEGKEHNHLYFDYLNSDKYHLY